MNVTFLTKGECADCGAEIDGFMQRSIRVNKASIRSDRDGLGAFRRCPNECPGGIINARYEGLDPASLARVNVYRERKGWGPLPATFKVRT